MVGAVARRQHLSAPNGALNPVRISTAGIVRSDDDLWSQDRAPGGKDLSDDVFARDFQPAVKLAFDPCLILRRRQHSRMSLADRALLRIAVHCNGTHEHIAS